MPYVSDQDFGNDGNTVCQHKYRNRESTTRDTYVTRPKQGPVLVKGTEPLVACPVRFDWEDRGV